ncbi:hypothetical protein [Roseisolibacter sp. H3M3-2]|uniref:hypothetical protein n=1 Tax=Roseisolibacter sp. H3M3-2 TaxID=3031323 RepID=UPI0023DB2802|nr:hypothetical protein [Roseisolibacter sp. H3M3-2]MDF1503032.1 hypothetical protein [Roseisolibacter sp. H3M3-2]
MSATSTSSPPPPTAAYSPRSVDPRPDSDELSIFELTALVLRARWRILAIGFLGAVVAVAPIAFRDPSFSASGSFIVQGSESPRAGLAGLAGQLGVALPGGGTQSPQFYADVMKTRELLAPIAADSFATTPGGRKVPFVELFLVEGATPAIRHERAIQELELKVLEVRLAKATGIVTVLATSKWPVVSLAIVERALGELNGFTLRMRQSQAAADRRFGEERVRVAREALRRAEDRLQSFLQGNRSYEESPSLTFTFDRLRRDVQLQQQVFTSASEGIEDARGREMRDTPVLTPVDTPVLPASPNPRGRVKRAIVGMLFGLFAGFVWALVRAVVARARAHGDPGASALGDALGDVRGDLTRWGRGGRRPADASAP